MKFFWLSFFSAVFILMFFLTSCDGPIIGGECSDVEPTLHQTLGSVQKVIYTITSIPMDSIST